MLSLSPAKLLVILVVALIVLGPDKLPGLARQAGAAWHDLRAWRSRLESEVRGVFPDLPSAQQVTQAVRSPLSFLDDLADKHAASNGDAGKAGAGSSPAAANGAGGGPAGARDGSWARQPPASGAAPAAYTPAAYTPAGWDAATDPEAAADDPSMN